MASGVAAWSQTAASNSTADSTVNFAEGMAPSAVNDSARALMASVAKFRDDQAGSLTTAGTSTAYTLTSNQSFASLSAMSGVKFCVRFNATNGASPTLNVDSLGAKAIQTASGTAIPTGAILANSVHELTYDNSIPAWLIHGSFGVFAATTFSGAVTPTTSDGAALGSASLMWSDLFLASGGVINWNNGDVTATHSANALAFAGASSGYSFDAPIAVTGNSTITGTFAVSSTLTASSGFTVSSGSVSLPAASVADAALASPGCMKLIYAQAASSSATIDFNQSNSASAFDGTYDRLVLVISAAKPATDDVEAWIRIGTGGTPTYQTSGYSYSNNATVIGVGNVAAAAASQAKIILVNTGAGGSVGNATGENFSGTLTFDQPSATNIMSVSWNGTYNSATADLIAITGGGAYMTATAVTAIRFLFESGNIASGNFALYGIKKS